MVCWWESFLRGFPPWQLFFFAAVAVACRTRDWLAVAALPVVDVCFFLGPFCDVAVLGIAVGVV